LALDFRFIFRSEFDPSDDLEQGDIIRRGPEIVEMLDEPHGYYAKAQDYSHFLVLTQSCDLVKYGKGIKSNYITIAALRPFSKFVEKVTGKNDCSRDGVPVRLLQAESKILIKQKIEQLLHYDLPGYFFVPAGSVRSIDVPLVAFLQLAVSIKPEHYERCKSDRVGKLQNVFSAKLGWLTGNQYSRVATPDIDNSNERGSTLELLKSLFDHYIDNDVFWFTQKQLGIFDKKVAAETISSHGPLPHRRALEIAAEVPPEIEEVADIVAKLAGQLGGAIPNDKIENLRNQVRNHRRLKSIVAGKN